MFISFSFYRAGVVLLVSSVNNNDLEFIRVYNHHIFFEPLHSFFRFRSSAFNSSRDFSVHEIGLSSPKLCNSAFSIQSKRSLTKMLKRTGPKIDPCGTR